MNELKQKLECCRQVVRSNWTMIRLYLKQGDRQESICKCVKDAKLALVEAQVIEMEFTRVREDVTREIKIAA
jgi:hypothetical protein